MRKPMKSKPSPKVKAKGTRPEPQPKQVTSLVTKPAAAEKPTPPAYAYIPRPLGGPPPEYKPKYAETVRGLAQHGATNAEILNALGIAHDVFLLWRVIHAEFDLAVKANDAAQDGRVKDALYQRALGYEHRSEKLITVGETVKAINFIEHIPADVGAATAWLRARDPKNWQQRRTVDTHITVGRITQDMSPQEASDMYRRTLEGAVIEGEFTEAADE